MAGGPNAAAVMCLHCFGRADRVSEGLETDYYECGACGTKAGVDWSQGQPARPCWPPSPRELAEAKQLRGLPHPEHHTPSRHRIGEGGWLGLALVGWVALAATAAAVGGIASRDAAVFYGALAKPTWAPPGWVFGPVWSALYLLMGVAAWLVGRVRPSAPAGRAARRHGLALFIAQLGLNALWTWLFFAWRHGAAAFGEIVLLWAAVALTTWHFGRVRPLAAYLLVPYLGWVTFATALTWAVWQRNPGQL